MHSFATVMRIDVAVSKLSNSSYSEEDDLASRICTC
jgi:hypothetical protein